MKSYDTSRNGRDMINECLHFIFSRKPRNFWQVGQPSIAPDVRLAADRGPDRSRGPVGRAEPGLVPYCPPTRDWTCPSIARPRLVSCQTPSADDGPAAS